MNLHLDDQDGIPMRMMPKTAPPGVTGRCLPVLLTLMALGLPEVGRPAPAHTGEPSPGATQPDTLRLDWSEFQRAIENHPRLAETLAARREAAGATREARALPNPDWEARALRVDPTDAGDPTLEREGSVSLPMDFFWTRPGAVREARARETGAEADVRSVERALLLEAGEVFWTVVRDQALSASLDVLEIQLQELQMAVETRVRVGESRPVEATRARVEALQAGLEATAARRSLAASRELLAGWLATGERRTLVAAAELEILAALPVSGSTADLSTHPLLKAAQARLEAERGALAVERGRSLPGLDLQAGLERAADRHATAVGIAVELPLFNWNRGPIQQAKARLAAAEAGLENCRRELQAEWIQRLAAFETSREQARSYREEILPLAEEAARVLHGSWLAGEAGLFELIDARRTLADMRRQAILAYGQAQMDALRLEILLEKETNK